MPWIFAIALLGFGAVQSGVMPAAVQTQVDTVTQVVQVQKEKAEDWLEANTQPVDYSKMND